MIAAILEYNFMRNAFLAALLTSIVVGIIGTIAIEKKLISMSGGIAHASFGGIGLGYLIGIEPIITGLAFAIGSSLLISKMPEKSKMKADTMTGILWSFGMALGILFISLAPGYMPDMTSYLFGNILAIKNDYLIYMAIITVLIVAVFVLYYNHLTLYLFDEEYAAARGVRTGFLQNIVYLILPIGIMVLIKTVGITLTISLMTIPVSISKILFQSIRKVILFSILFAFLFSIIGLTISYYINIPSGVGIIVLSTLVYLAFMATHGHLQKSKHSHKVHHE
ncbi:MAG: metal ABC transporter permease [Eubacteriales bacterium]|nr:metal ABC transporter permease [Eubacteriales bacterium]